MAEATWVGGDGTGAEQTDYGRTANWSGGVVPDADDHVIVANTGHNCKLDANREAASLTINSSATLDGSGAKLSIKSEGDSSEGTDGYAVDIDGIIAGNLDLEITTAATTSVDIAPSSGTIRHLTINHASFIGTILGPTTITGNLTITAGELKTAGSNDLTVTGDVSVTGTLTGNASAISMGSLRIESGGTYSATSGTTTITDEASTGYAWYNIGTFTHNDGNVEFNHSESHLRENTFYDLNINCSSSSGYIQWREVSGNALTVANDLTVTSGRFKRNTTTDTLTVTGDVDIAANGILGKANAYSGANNFGSLTIASGGEYNATSGTTTITGANSNNHALEGTGTFTHNDGTLEFSNAGFRMPKSGTFNNVTVNGISSTGGIHCMSYSMLPHGVMPDGTSDNETISILGKLHIKNDDFRPYQVGDIFIHHLEIGDGTGSAETAMFGINADDVFDGKVVVDNVTIHSDGKLRFGDGDETSTTVGSSAMEVRGAFRNIGGSIDIV